MHQTHRWACLTALLVTCESQAPEEVTVSQSCAGPEADLCCHAWPPSTDYSIASSGFELEKWEVEEKWENMEGGNVCARKVST